MVLRITEAEKHPSDVVYTVRDEGRGRRPNNV